ncbi:MAG: hypothetical protein HFJ94_08790 [Muribaculaceae bacterium]|nr:hypothetical protein [Muribaculaceae bacterium]
MIARDNTPRWVLVLLIILALPVCQLPFLLDNAPAGVPLVSTLLRIYPFYIVTAAYLAYVCYPRRALMSWILMALILLSHIAVWLLVSPDLNLQQ